MRLWRKLPRTNNHPFTDECETRCRKVLRFLFEVEVFSEKTSFKNANFHFTTNFRRLPTRRLVENDYSAIIKKTVYNRITRIPL